MELAEEVVGFLQDLLHSRPAEITVFAQDDHRREKDLMDAAGGAAGLGMLQLVQPG